MIQSVYNQKKYISMLQTHNYQSLVEVNLAILTPSFMKYCYKGCLTYETIVKIFNTHSE